MPFASTKQIISFDQIDWEDETFRTSYFRDLSDIKNSIEAAGIMNPPYVLAGGGGKYRILSGWRRLLALEQLNQDCCDVLILDKDYEELELFQLMLNENLSIREFNIMEKAVIIQRWCTHFHIATETVCDVYLPLLKLGKNPKWLDWAAKLANYSQKVQQYFAEDRLSFDLIDHLSAMAPFDMDAFVEVVIRLHLGKNRQKEMFFLLSDLARMQNFSMAALIRSEQIQAIISTDKMTHSQMTARLIQFLKSQRYPNFMKVERKFMDYIKSLNLPGNMELKHSPFFESDRFRIDFTFRNLEEFKQAVAVQNRMISEKRIDPLINLTNWNFDDV